jgi:hypothetical protein
MGPTPPPAGQREPATSETEPTDGGSILVQMFSLPWELPSSSCGCSDFAPQANSAVVLGLSQPGEGQG